MIDSDPKIAKFIMDIRSKSELEIKSLVLEHRKDLARHNKINGAKAYYIYYRHLYLLANGMIIDKLDFIRALGSNDIRIKRFAYLALTFSSLEDLQYSFLNILKYDLNNEHFREYVLMFLANCKILNTEYNKLSEQLHYFIKNSTKSLSKLHVVYYKLENTISDINIFEQNENLFFVKIQILIDSIKDNFINSEFFENEKVLNFIQNFFRRTSKYYIRTKCVQVFKILAKKSYSLQKSLLEFIDDSISLARLLKKSMGEIAYYVECVELLLIVSYQTHKVGTFIFKMLESKNETFMKLACIMSGNYNIYSEISLEKCILMGLENDENLEIFTKMIKEDNYRQIYSRKEEIILSLESNCCTDEVIRSVLNQLLKKIFTFVDSKTAMQIYLNEPLFCIEEPIDKFLIREDRYKIFDELKDKKDPNQFCLFYQTIDFENSLSDRFLKNILEKHLRILKAFIVAGNTQPHITYTLAYLLSIVHILGGIPDLRDNLISIFREINIKNGQRKLKEILLKNIFLCSLYTREKTFYVGKDIFLNYSFSEENGTENITINFPSFISGIEAYSDMSKLLMTNYMEYSDNKAVTYELGPKKDVKLLVDAYGLSYEGVIS